MTTAKKLEVMFTPAEFATLANRDLSRTVAIVFDVLRATSSMITALANGAEALFPVSEITEALSMKKRYPDALLAGERDGVRIEADLTGGIAFDLGNSPREFTPQRVRGKRIITTTTNGTRALRACVTSKTVLVSSFLNLRATAEFLHQIKPEQVLVICSGTYEEAAYEDVLGAGALCDFLWPEFDGTFATDSALIAKQIWQQENQNLLAALSKSRNGNRLLGRPELRDDVVFCAQRNIFDFVAVMGTDGWVRKLTV